MAISYLLQSGPGAASVAFKRASRQDIIGTAPTLLLRTPLVAEFDTSFHVLHELPWPLAIGKTRDSINYGQRMIPDGIDRLTTATLDLLFDAAVSLLSVGEPTSLFAKDATVVFVPRRRPLLAVNMAFGDVLRLGCRLAIANGKYSETRRVREPDNRSEGYVRISSDVRVELPNSARVLSANVMLAIKEQPAAQVISCCIVYDEHRILSAESFRSVHAPLTSFTAR